jgi:DNA-directed RNA polymerase subunit H (RpoH/RPB5)
MTENKKIIAVHKSREVILDILTRRGYKTEEYTGFSISEIHALFVNKQLDLLLSTGGDVDGEEGKKAYIKYYLDKTIRPSNIHDFIDDLFNIEQVLSKKDDLIIIIKDDPNDTLQKLQSSVYEHDGIFVTIININRLQFNILNHSLVPKHIVLTDKEAALVKKKYNVVSNSNFPEISRFDPVSQVMGIRPGELFEIERSSKTAITSKFYRICSQ